MRSVGSVATAVLAALAFGYAQDAGEGPPETIVYELSQGGVPLGEVGVALERTEDGFRSESYVTLHGLVELQDTLVASADGAALSYRLSGMVQGIEISMDGAFSRNGVAFELTQAGQGDTFELATEEPLYVLDNNFIDGFQVLAYVALDAGEALDVAAVVPQAGALGRARADLRDGTEEVTVGGRTVEAMALDIVLTVGQQEIPAVAWLDPTGGIVALDQPLGNVRFARRYDAAQPRAAEDESPAEVADTAAELIERTASCVESRDLTIESTGASLYGQLSLPVERPDVGAPTLILLPGSGPVDVAGNALPLIGNSGYKQLAFLLGCEGYGVLRVAKLGIPPSTGDGNAVTLETYAENTADWLDELARTDGVDAQRLGLIGHSEGGLIALYAVAEGHVEPDVVVLLATAGRPLGVVLREQVVASAVRGGLDHATAEGYGADVDELLDAVRESSGTALDLSGDLQDNEIAPAFAAAAGLLRSEIDEDPLSLAAQVSVPVLVVQGLKDVQVLRVDGQLLAEALPAVLYLELPDLTHNLVETRASAEALLVPGRDATVSETLARAVATFLHGTLKLAR